MHAERLAFLDQNQIPYQRFSHPPVFTCEEARQVAPDLPGADTKNLFLRDGKGKRHFLVTVPDHKSVNLKALSAALEVKNLTFASPERLLRFLGVTPGAVTLLGVFNDSERAVEVVLDTELWDSDAILAHPLVNTETLSIPTPGLMRFLELSGHPPVRLSVPQPEAA